MAQRRKPRWRLRWEGECQRREEDTQYQAEKRQLPPRETRFGVELRKFLLFAA